MEGGYEAAQQALQSIQDYATGDEAPLEALLDNLRGVLLAPEATAPPHEGLRAALAGLLYNSHTPRDLAKWLASTDLTAGRQNITAGRKKVGGFRLSPRWEGRGVTGSLGWPASPASCLSSRAPLRICRRPGPRSGAARSAGWRQRRHHHAG